MIPCWETVVQTRLIHSILGAVVSHTYTGVVVMGERICFVGLLAWNSICGLQLFAYLKWQFYPLSLATLAISTFSSLRLINLHHLPVFTAAFRTTNSPGANSYSNGSITPSPESDYWVWQVTAHRSYDVAVSFHGYRLDHCPDSYEDGPGWKPKTWWSHGLCLCCMYRSVYKVMVRAYY